MVQARADFLAYSWHPDGSPHLVLVDWYVPNEPAHYRASMSVEKRGATMAGAQNVTPDDWVTINGDPVPPQEVTISLAKWLADESLS